MAKKRPVNTWTIKHSPKRDPKFHRDLILEGVGSSTKEPLTIFINGWTFINEIIYLHFSGSMNNHVWEIKIYIYNSVL